ncbi:hypothetical protein FOL47_003559 [Perkinsus chesapeaki]|uniref:Uncharacterized protein n=1 Tax=Perkinsus chesapeaki TaxID=330153 RepID=A0A7J6M8T6_PERCH|nr:hypothetical protein FOL47_003559 [Perkinsus chesapeaki]
MPMSQSPYRSSIIGTKLQRTLSTIEADRALQAMARDELVGIYPSYDPRDDELDHYLLRFEVECAVPKAALVDDPNTTVSVICGVAVHSSGEPTPEIPKRATDGDQEDGEDDKSPANNTSVADGIASHAWVGPLETWPGAACWLWTERTAYGGCGRRGTRRHQAGGDALRSRPPNSCLLASTSPRLNGSSNGEEVVLVNETWEILVHGDVCEWSVLSNTGGQVRSEVFALNRSDGLIYIFNLSCSSSDKLCDVDVTMRDIEIIALDTADEFFTRIS